MPTSPTAANIAAQIRRARKARGLSQKDLAEVVGVAERTVSAAEQGKAVRPGNLYAIRTYLGLPDGDQERDPDSPREQKLSLLHDLLDKWVAALPEDQLDPAATELSRWIVSRM